MPEPLSETLVVTQYQKNDPVPEESIPVLTELHENIMVPVIKKFGTVIITSGHRSVEANELAHGQSSSEHIYTDTHCADDFFSPNIPARTIFDWMRLNPSLPFHQLILEHSANGSSVIHVSLNKLMPGVRSVKEGATHNASRYTNVDHVAYEVPNNHEAVNDAANG